MSYQARARIFIRGVSALLAFCCVAASAQMQTNGAGSVDSWGQSRFTVPLLMPPGVNGMLPSLSLSYSSLAQDGPFGVGWKLEGLSSITRCPAVLATEGFVGGVRFDSNDRFCLDGQKLVAIGTGTYGADGTEYRTEAETFTKIVSHGVAGSGPVYFDVWTKSGLIEQYGQTADSRFPAAPNGSVREWALNRVADRSANYYTVTYTVNAANNEVVPASIDYTGNTNAAVTPTASVQFSYAARPDSESYFVGLAQVGRTLRATNIATFSQGALVTNYPLTYDVGPTSARSRLASINQCGASGSCLGAISLTSQAGGGGITQPGAVPVNLGNLGSPGSTVVSLLKGDFNGDGIDDLVVVDSLNAARICYGPNFSAASCGQAFGMPQQLQVLDYNGDGISDLALLSSGQLRFCPGPSPDPSGTGCAVIPNQTFSGYAMIAGDFNGDGKDDIYLWNLQNPAEHWGMYCDDIPANLTGRYCNGKAMNGTGYRVFKGDFDGDGITDLLMVGASDYWVCTGYATLSGSGACSHVLTGFNFSTTTVLVGDFNGDSISDIMLVTATDVQFCPGPAAITANACGHVPNTGGPDANVVVADFDGDGATDVLFARTEGSYFSSGRTFLRTGPWSLNSTVNWRSTPIITGNFLGRGASDVIGGSATLQLVSGATVMPDLLASATNTSFGTATSFSYLPLTDATVYTKGTTSVWPLQDIKRPWYVTSQMTAPTGVWNVRKTLSYRYEKGHVSLEGRGGSMAPFNRNFTGFEVTHQTDSSNGRETVSSWLLDFPHNGRVQETTTYVGGQVAAHRTRQLASTVTFENRQMSIVRSEWVTSFGLDGDWTNTRYDYGYDTYGNQASISIYNNSYGTQYADTRQTVNLTFTNDTTYWLIGAPASKDVSYNTPAGSQYLQQERYTTVPGTLLIQQRVKEPFTPQLQVTTDYTRNVFGLVTTETVTGNGMAGRTRTWTYGPKGRFASQTTNALNQATTLGYDPRFGTITSQADANGATTTWTYDELGRKVAENRPDGTQKTWQYVNCTGCRGYSENPNIAYDIYVQETGLPARYEYYDEIDRHVMSTRATFDGANWIDENNVWYSTDSKVVRKYISYGRGDAVHPYTSSSYDSYGRLSSETAADGGVTSYAYSAAPNAGPITTTVTNPRGYATLFVRDVWNQLLQVTDAANGMTSYSYDTLGKLSQVTDARGNVTTFGHNKYGWLTSKNDPDLGSWTYGYDALGEMTTQTDAKGQLTTYGYDALSRKTSQSEPSQTGTWVYDTATYGIGKLATHYTNSGVQVTNSYDSAGRLSVRTTAVDGASYSIGYGYDASGRAGSVSYPNGFGITYVYDSTTNYLTEIRNAATGASIWKIRTADAYGPTNTDMGNGTGAAFSYDANTHRVRSIAAIRDSDSSIVQGFTYNYDLMGNVTARADTTTGLSETFGYDPLDRLTSVAGPAPKTYEFDVIGNITNKTDVAPYMAGGAYLYQAGKAHAVSTVQGAYSFGYDANGNMVNGRGRTITLNSFNLPVSISNGAVTYSWAYDANYIRSKLSTSSDTKVYVRDTDGKPIYERTAALSGLITEKHLIFANGRAVAQFTRRSTGQNDFRYFYRDKFGSITLALDETGQVVERLAYDAFGKRRFPSGADDSSNSLRGTTTSYSFSGHEYLEDLGLIHMNGRIYDPLMGRFISADPRDGKLSTPQDLNRYSYVLNAPLQYVDPTGFGATSTDSDDVISRQNGGEIPDHTEQIVVDGNRIPPDFSPWLAIQDIFRGGASASGGNDHDCKGPETMWQAGLGYIVAGGPPPAFFIPSITIGGGVQVGITSTGRWVGSINAVVGTGVGVFAGLGWTLSETTNLNPISRGWIADRGPPTLQFDANAAVGVGGGISVSGDDSSTTVAGGIPLPVSGPISRFMVGYGAQASLGISRTAVLATPSFFGPCAGK